MLSSSEASAFIFLKTNNCRFFGPKNGPQNDRVGRFFHSFRGKRGRGVGGGILSKRCRSGQLFILVVAPFLTWQVRDRSAALRVEEKYQRAELETTVVFRVMGAGRARSCLRPYTARGLPRRPTTASAARYSAPPMSSVWSRPR